MISLGWGDPIESPVTLVYRRKGEKHEHSFHGPVAIIGEDRKKLTWLKREELPLKDGRLDMTNVPVVGIGGKRKHQPGRAQSFLEENPSFQGALILYPGTGNWDLGEGMLFVTSREVLEGRRFSGGRVEVQFTNYRWLRDGKYVADKAKMLHGKVLETLEPAVEQTPGAEEIVKAIVGWSCPFEHRLHSVCKSVSDELYKLESRRVMLKGEQTRDMTALVRERILAKLQNAGVRKVADIPNDLTVSAEEIAPELVAQAETLGTIEIPGLGRRLLTGRQSFFIGGCAMIEINPEELKQVTDWPHVGVGIKVPELQDSLSRDLEYGELHDLLFKDGESRWPKILGYYAKRWTEVQRQRNYPKEIKVTSPREADVPATPNPIQWGSDLLINETFTAYAALCKLHGYSEEWAFKWFDSEDEAAKADVEARQEAESYITARRLEAELTANAEAVPFPQDVPVRPKELDDYELPREKRDEIAAWYQTKVREFVAALEAAPQWSCLPSKLADEVRKAAEYGYDLEKLASRLSEAWAQAEQLRQLKDAGEILVNWGGHFRVMGRTGNAQYWVLRPNGQERNFDEVSYRKRYTSEGEKFWRLVGREELAISWFKSCSAAAHEFVVNHLPVGGPTQEQLAFVAELEEKIAGDWEGAHGLASGEASPSIGNGWGLHNKSKPEPMPTPAGSDEKADLSQVDLSKLFNGGAKFRQ